MHDVDSIGVASSPCCWLHPTPTQPAPDPVIGFVFGQKGLMYNLTLEGSKFTKLEKK